MSIHWARYATMYRCVVQGPPEAVNGFCSGIEVWVPGARVRDGSRGAHGVDLGTICLDAPVHAVRGCAAWAAHLGVALTGWKARLPSPLRRRDPATEMRSDPDRRAPYPWQREAAQAVLSTLEGDHRGAGLNMGCGGGKTMTLLEVIAHLEGGVLILGPAVARSAWLDDGRAALAVEIHVMYPKSERRAGDLDLAAYLEACRGFPAAPDVPQQAARVHLWASPQAAPFQIDHVRGRISRMGRVVLTSVASENAPPPAGTADAFVLLGDVPSEWQAAAERSGRPMRAVELPRPQRPWVVAGFEVFADVVAEMDTAGFAPGILVLDEWHQLSEAGIWKREAREPGGPCPRCGAAGEQSGPQPEECTPAAACKKGCDGVKWRLRGTKGAERQREAAKGTTAWERAGKRVRAPSKRTLRTAAVWEYRQRPHIDVVIATTATLPESADQAKAFMPLSILFPYQWGKRRSFEAHFASGRVAEPPHPRAGYWVTGPNSCTDDLRTRCTPFITRVPPEVSHEGVRPMAIRTVWLAPSTQTRRAKPMAVRLPGEGEGAGTVAAGSAPRSRSEAEGRSREGRIMRALAAARGPVLRDALDILEAGQAVVLLTTRLDESAELYRQLHRKAPKGALVARADGSAPSQRARVEIKDDWLRHIESGRPGALVGTGYAWASSANGLHRAHVIMQTGLPDSPVHQIQWCGRGHRHNSRCAEYRIYIPEGTIYDDVARKIEERCGDLRRLFDPAHAAELSEALSELGDLTSILASILAEPPHSRRRPA